MSKQSKQSRMKVLIACEFSGIVREAFAKRGHSAWSCDLLPTEIPGQHIQDNIMNVLRHGGEDWDLVIAHPPCTNLASCGARSFKEKREDGRQKQAILFFEFFTMLKTKKICIENPVGIMSTLYRKPDQIIQPYYFGDPIPKQICLWLKNLPKLKPTNIVKPGYLYYNSKKTKSGKSKYSIFGKLGKGHGHERSRFFPGIANAMAEQWG